MKLGILLIRDNLEVEILENYMDAETATIWVRIGSGKNNSITVGGIYREHQQLGRIDPNATSREVQLEQEKRWRIIVNKWKLAARNQNCVVLGDLNLDYLRWNNPEFHLQKMVELVQSQIETLGFVQLVSDSTRAWKNQADSLLDQIWTNCPSKIICHKNQVRGSSDHNVITAEYPLKTSKLGDKMSEKESGKILTKIDS